MSDTTAASDADANKRPALPASSKSIGDYFKGESDGTNFSDIECQQISKLLLANDEASFSQVPRLYIVLRLVGQVSILPRFIDLGLNDLCFPFNSSSLPKALSPSYQEKFLQLQHKVHTKGLALENSEQRHVHFSKGEPLPLVAKERLGDGGYGFVDKVESQFSGRILARKRFLRKGLGSTTELKSFLTEINNMKKIHHQHCVEFVASYTDSRYFALLMLPVAECDLEAYYTVALSDESHITRLRTFFGCLASAMSHLHNDVKIRHRDIKPKNILVKGENVYLTDFGISLDWEQLSRSTTTADTGKSWIYCAPEVANYEPRNSSSDVWSLGCVFLEMYTVIRGITIASMRELFRAKTGTYRFYENANFIPLYLHDLDSPEDSLDNTISDWILKTIQPQPSARASSKELYELICGTSAKRHFACDNCAIIDYDDDASSGTDADDASLNDWILSGALKQQHSFERTGTTESNVSYQLSPSIIPRNVEQPDQTPIVPSDSRQEPVAPEPAEPPSNNESTHTGALLNDPRPAWLQAVDRTKAFSAKLQAGQSEMQQVLQSLMNVEHMGSPPIQSTDTGFGTALILPSKSEPNLVQRHSHETASLQQASRDHTQENMLHQPTQRELWKNALAARSMPPPAIYLGGDLVTRRSASYNNLQVHSAVPFSDGARFLNSLGSTSSSLEPEDVPRQSQGTIASHPGPSNSKRDIEDTSPVMSHSSYGPGLSFGFKPAMSLRETVKDPLSDESLTTLCTATSVWGWVARAADEVSFNEGDKIRVYEYTNRDWWFGENYSTEKAGLFPSSYVRKNILFTATAVADFGHTFLEPDESGIPKDVRLSMKPLDMIQVLFRYETASDWYRGRNESSNEEGVFPLHVVERNPPLKARRTPDPSTLKSGELLVSLGDTIQVFEYNTNRTGWWKGRNDNTGQEGLFHKSWVEENLAAPTVRQEASTAKDMGLPDEGTAPFQEDSSTSGTDSSTASHINSASRISHAQRSRVLVQQHTTRIEAALLADLKGLTKPWPPLILRGEGPHIYFSKAPGILSRSWEHPQAVLDATKVLYQHESSRQFRATSQEAQSLVAKAEHFDLYNIFKVLIAHGLTLEMFQMDSNSFHPLHHLLSTDAWLSRPTKESRASLTKMWKPFSMSRSTSKLPVDKEKQGKRSRQDVELASMTTLATLIFVIFVESATTIDTLMPPDTAQDSALHMAIYESNLPAVLCLLEKDWPVEREFSVSCSIGKRSSYPLTHACLVGSIEIFEALLEKGAYINHADSIGWKPAFAALYKGHYRILDRLLELQATLEAPPSESNLNVEPFMVAVNMGNSKTVKVLLDRGYKPAYPYPLTNPISNGDLSMIRLLLHHNIVGDAPPARLYREAKAARSHSREIEDMLLEKKIENTKVILPGITLTRNRRWH